MTAPTIVAPSAIDTTANGTTWVEKDANTPRLPASLNKVMTLLVARQHITDAMLSQTVEVIASDLIGGSTANLQAGDVITWSDLLHGMMLPSGNDAATAVARLVGGIILTSEGGTGDPVARFLTAMTDTGTTLGWDGHVFGSPSGLDLDSRMSARMVSQLGHALDPWSVAVMGTLSHQITVTGPNARTWTVLHSINPDSPVQLRNWVAGKTGTYYTPVSTANLLTVWTVGGVRHSMALLGGWPRETRFTDTQALQDYLLSVLDPLPDIPMPDGVPLDMAVQVEGRTRPVVAAYHRVNGVNVPVTL